MLVERRSLIGSLRGSNSVNTGEKPEFDTSGVLLSEVNPILFTDAAVLWSLWPFLRPSSDSGVAAGCRRHGSEETAVILGIVLLRFACGARFGAIQKLRQSVQPEGRTLDFT